MLAILLAHFRSAHEALRGGGLLEGEAAEPGVPLLTRLGEAADPGDLILE